MGAYGSSGRSLPARADPLAGTSWADLAGSGAIVAAPVGVPIELAAGPFEIPDVGVVVEGHRLVAAVDDVVGGEVPEPLPAAGIVGGVDVRVDEEIAQVLIAAQAGEVRPAIRRRLLIQSGVLGRG